MADIPAEPAVANDAIPADQALANIDQALDVIVAALVTIEENLPYVVPENVPQKAALDNAKESLEQGVKPYVGEVIQAMSFFD